MHFYAQLNAEDIVIGVSQLNGEVESEMYVSMDNFDTSVIGKKYNRDKEIFEDVLIVPEPPNPDPMDAIMAGMADMDARQTQAIDALMSGIMELYEQIEALKNGGIA